MLLFSFDVEMLGHGYWVICRPADLQT